MSCCNGVEKKDCVLRHHQARTTFTKAPSRPSPNAKAPAPTLTCVSVMCAGHAAARRDMLEIGGLGVAWAYPKNQTMDGLDEF